MIGFVKLKNDDTVRNLLRKSKILQELKKFKVFRSLKLRIFLIIVLVGFISCLVMRYGIVQSYFNRALQVRSSDVTNQLVILADHLNSYNYLQNTNSDVISAELALLSNLYDGRVLIIDQNFNVVKDTYEMSRGKTIISQEVIRCFKGNGTVNYDNKNQFIEITVPIRQVEDERTKIAGVILCSVSADSIVLNQEILSRYGLIISLLLMVLIIFIAYILSTVLLKPFNRVTDAINEVKAGFTNEKIEVNDYTETEHIVDAFNQLQERMKVLDDSRQEFVSNVSHELKTPLTSVKVLADSINTMEDAPVELYKEFMADIVNEIDRENRIINDLLELVKLDKTAGNLNIEMVNINQLLEAVFKRLHPIAQKQNVDLILESARQVNAEVDEVKLSLAFTNLIENGIKYNRESGFVKVNLDADYQDFTVEISDSGIGIPEEDQKHIFERFYRVDKSHSREIGGTGLGLAITRNAILMHRGSIQVDSVPEQGTTFIVKIPINYLQPANNSKGEEG